MLILKVLFDLILSMFQYWDCCLLIPCPYFPWKLQFDITFPALSCSILSLDAMDISGEEHLDIVCLSARSVLSS